MSVTGPTPPRVASAALWGGVHAFRSCVGWCPHRNESSATGAAGRVVRRSLGVTRSTNWVRHYRRVNARGIPVRPPTTCVQKQEDPVPEWTTSDPRPRRRQNGVLTADSSCRSQRRLGMSVTGPTPPRVASAAVWGGVHAYTTPPPHHICHQYQKKEKKKKRKKVKVVIMVMNPQRRWPPAGWFVAHWG